MKIGDLVGCKFYYGFGIIIKKLSYEERGHDPWPMYQCCFCVIDSGKIFRCEIMKFREKDLFLRYE
jgi:hypothetical protein